MRQLFQLFLFIVMMLSEILVHVGSGHIAHINDIMYRTAHLFFYDDNRVVLYTQYFIVLHAQLHTLSNSNSNPHKTVAKFRHIQQTVD